MKLRSGLGSEYYIGIDESVREISYLNKNYLKLKNKEIYDERR